MGKHRWAGPLPVREICWSEVRLGGTKESWREATTTVDGYGCGIRGIVGARSREWCGSMDSHQRDCKLWLVKESIILSDSISSKG